MVAQDVVVDIWHAARLGRINSIQGYVKGSVQVNAKVPFLRFVRRVPTPRKTRIPAIKIIINL